MLVLQQPRVWYLVDARSPLMIVGPDELRVSDADFGDIFTEGENREILESIFEAYKTSSRWRVRGRSEQELRTAFASITTAQLRGLVEGEIRGWAGDWVADVAIEVFRGLLDSIINDVRQWLQDVAAPSCSPIDRRCHRSRADQPARRRSPEHRGGWLRFAAPARQRAPADEPLQPAPVRRPQERP